MVKKEHPAHLTLRFTKAKQSFAAARMFAKAKPILTKAKEEHSD